jgi:hypothetical protein
VTREVLGRWSLIIRVHETRPKVLAADNLECYTLPLASTLPPIGSLARIAHTFIGPHSASVCDTVAGMAMLGTSTINLL